MTKIFGMAQTERRTLEKSAACCEGWERNLFNQRDELFYDSLLCCVCLLFALFCLRLFNKHFMLECTEATKSFRVSFQPYISLACMLQLLDFLPQRRTQLFFPFSPPAQTFLFASRAVPINTPQWRRNVPGRRKRSNTAKHTLVSSNSL